MSDDFETLTDDITNGQNRYDDWKYGLAIEGKETSNTAGNEVPAGGNSVLALQSVFEERPEDYERYCQTPAGDEVEFRIEKDENNFDWWFDAPYPSDGDSNTSFSFSLVAPLPWWFSVGVTESNNLKGTSVDDDDQWNYCKWVIDTEGFPTAQDDTRAVRVGVQHGAEAGRSYDITGYSKYTWDYVDWCTDGQAVLHTETDEITQSTTIYSV